MVVLWDIPPGVPRKALGKLDPFGIGGVAGRVGPTAGPCLQSSAGASHLLVRLAIFEVLDKAGAGQLARGIDVFCSGSGSGRRVGRAFREVDHVGGSDNSDEGRKGVDDEAHLGILSDERRGLGPGGASG